MNTATGRWIGHLPRGRWMHTVFGVGLYLAARATAALIHAS